MLYSSYDSLIIAQKWYFFIFKLLLDSLKIWPAALFVTELEKCSVVYVFNNDIMRILWTWGVRVKWKQWVPRENGAPPQQFVVRTMAIDTLPEALHSTTLILLNAFSIMLFSYSSSRCLFNPIFDSHLQYGQYKQRLPIRD